MQVIESIDILQSMKSIVLAFFLFLALIVLSLVISKKLAKSKKSAKILLSTFLIGSLALCVFACIVTTQNNVHIKGQGKVTQIQNNETIKYKLPNENLKSVKTDLIKVKDKHNRTFNFVVAKKDHHFKKGDTMKVDTQYIIPYFKNDKKYDDIFVYKYKDEYVSGPQTSDIL